MVSAAQLEEAQRAIVRSEGYCELGMYEHAEQELQSVPLALRGTLNYLSAIFVVYIRMDRIQEATNVGRRILEEWPVEGMEGA